MLQPTLPESSPRQYRRAAGASQQLQGVLKSITQDLGVDLREFSFHPITGAPRKFARVRFQSHAPGTKPAHLPTSHHPPPPLPFGSNLSNCKHYQPPGGRFEISRGPVRGTTPFQIFLWQHGPGVQAVEFADANPPLWHQGPGVQAVEFADANPPPGSKALEFKLSNLQMPICPWQGPSSLPKGSGSGAHICFCYQGGPDPGPKFAT